MLTHISGEKYFGLIVTEVAFPSDIDVAKQMILRGLAEPYG
jgi:hypothetical protein